MWKMNRVVVSEAGVQSLPSGSVPVNRMGSKMFLQQFDRSISTPHTSDDLLRSSLTVDTILLRIPYDVPMQEKSWLTLHGF